MSTFGQSLSRELGKNTGKWVSNKVFGNTGWATPRRHIIEVEERKKAREKAREYKNLEADIRRKEKWIEREEKRIAKEEAAIAKEEFQESNRQEVENHNNYIQVIQSVHKDYASSVDWNEILTKEPPKEVEPTNTITEYYRELTNEQIDKQIQDEKNNLKLSFANLFLKNYYNPRFQFLFKISKSPVPLIIVIVGLLGSLEKATVLHILSSVVFGILLIPTILLKFGAKDYEKIKNIENNIKEIEQKREVYYNEYIADHEKEYQQYLKNKAEYERIINIAKGVKNSDKQSFIYAINYFNPFEDLKNYGSDISYSIEKNILEINFFAKGEEVIPHTTKRLLRNGNEIKEDPLPTSRFYEIYQDYICSCILRIAKETFNLLPIDKVLINAKQNKLNRSIGKYQNETIVSIVIDKPNLEKLNFDLLDPSDSMMNFTTQMDFSKDSGFFGIAPAIINNSDEPLKLKPIVEPELIKIWDNSKYRDYCVYKYLFPTQLEAKAILFIGINPSYTEEDKDLTNYTLTQKGNKNQYFKKFEDISEFTNTKWTHLDLLYFRSTNQSYVNEIMKGGGIGFIWEQLQISKRIIEGCNPKTIVVCNSLAAKFLGRDKKGSTDVWLGFEFVPNEKLAAHTWNGIPVFFSSMLTGQGALDKGSYERLKMQIKNALNIA